MLVKLILITILLHWTSIVLLFKRSNEELCPNWTISLKKILVVIKISPIGHTNYSWNSNKNIKTPIGHTNYSFLKIKK